MIPTNVKRPRNVDVSRAAAILYGDWGTSKAYVIGLAFRGNVIRDVSDLLPEEIDLLVYA